MSLFVKLTIKAHPGKEWALVMDKCHLPVQQPSIQPIPDGDFVS